MASRREPQNKQESLSLARRDAQGHILPGHTGNPGGRPKGIARLAREATRGGEDTVAFFTLVSRGEKPIGWPESQPLTAEHMIDAHKWLADRGFGRVPITVDDERSPEDEVRRNLAGFTLEELMAMREAIRREQRAIPTESRVVQS